MSERKAVSRVVADYLKRGRARSGMSFREVEQQTRARGLLVPFSTLAKIERGRLEPGLKRLRQLLDLYGAPAGIVDELLDLEIFMGEPPRIRDEDEESAYARARALLLAGDVKQAMGYMFELRRTTWADEGKRNLSQKAMIGFALAAGSIGKHRLGLQFVDEVLIEGPGPDVLVEALVQAAICWEGLGGYEAALAFVERAEKLAAADSQRMGWVLQQKSVILRKAGQLDAASSCISATLRTYEECGDHYGVAKGLGAVARLELARGDVAAALAAIRTSLGIAREHGFERLVRLRTVMEGNLLAELGEVDAGVEKLRAGLAETITRDDDSVRFYAHYYLWKVYSKQRDAARAQVELEAARYYVRFVDESSDEARDVRS